MDPWNAIAWLEDERDNVVAAVHDLLGLGEADLAGRLAYAFGNFALMRGDYLPDASDLLSAALARRTTPMVQMSLQLGLGMVLRMLERHAEALPLLRQAYREARQRSPRHEIVAANGYALCCRRLGRMRQADVALQIAVELCVKHWPAGPAAGHTLWALGEHYGHYHFASEFGLAALTAAGEVFGATGDQWGSARALESAGILHSNARQWRPAIVHLERAVAADRDLGDRLTMTMAQQALAVAHLGAGEKDAARALLRRTTPAFQQMRHEWGEGVSRRLLGNLHLEEDDLPRAIRELESSVDILRRCGQPYSIAHTLSLLARAHARSGRPDLGVSIGQEALALFESVNAAYADNQREQVRQWRAAAEQQ
jgi:tetratricopeptide (TPR) repeat protein